MDWDIRKIVKSFFSRMGDGESQASKHKGSVLQAVLGMFLRLVAVMGAAFILAQMAAVICVPLIMQAVDIQGSKRSRAPAVQQYKLDQRPNFHTLGRNILKRNLFNAEGEFPVEEEPSEEEQQQPSSFSLLGPCKDSKIKNIQLVGTIFMAAKEQDSIAIIQEKGISSADLYKVGEFIIGQDNAQVVQVQKDQVVLNNGGVKECLKLNLVKFEGQDFTAKSGQKVTQGSGSGNTTDVVVESDFVRSQLGDSFSKIISSARLVPNISGNTSSGFKIFAISRGSLFDRVGLQNGDIITQVNDTVMEAQEGFALYKAFEDEQYIRISLLRKGKVPTTIMVQIK
ncbi:MAG: hypothetical protein OXT67_01715 [Zetaproteobacteria bacterium]|nr:hypothetical protein [Zetaproteobacteria bacterium]